MYRSTSPSLMGGASRARLQPPLISASGGLTGYVRPGVELLAELSGLAEALRGADPVITGEEHLAAQSLHGKTPVGVARLAQAAAVPVIALAGSLAEDYRRLYAEGIGAAFSLVPGPLSLEQACAGAALELQARAADLARVWQMAQGVR